MPYVTQQAVLEEAGLIHREVGSEPTGLANGSNRVFTVDRKPLGDNNYDDSIDIEDVTAYVNGTTVAVASVDETAGSVTLVAAPANATTVTVDYSFTSVPTTFVEEVIEEAADAINDAMGQVVITPYTTVPATVRKIARVYAAGLLLAREYGLQPDEEGVKQGARKIKQAEAWLASYRSLIETNGSDAGTVVVPRSSADCRLFQTYDESEGVWTPLADEGFSLNEVS